MSDDFQKTCPKCGNTLAFSSFYKDTSKKDGKTSYCIRCIKENMKKYRETDKGKESHKNDNKRYHQSDKGQEALKKAQKKYYRKRLELAKTFGTLQTAYINTEDPYIDIWLRFDTHYGYYQCDVFMLNSYLEWLAQHDHVYQFLGGDIIENTPTIESKLPMLRGQVIHPLRQINDIIPTLKHALCYIIGNHEGRSQKIDLTLKSDLIYKLQAMKIPILTANNHVYKLFVNECEYTFLLSHGWGGSQTPDYLIKKMFYDGLVPDEIDFIIVGHTHHNQPSIARDKAVIFDNVIQTKRMIGIRPGSFLYNPDYLSHGRETISGNVILRLSAKKWNYRVFENLRDLKETDL